MPTWVRYVLFQIPQWLLLAILLALAAETMALSAPVARGLFLLWVLKDLAVYPLVRHGYEANSLTGSERLVGHKAVTFQRLAPKGYVKIQGELWRAEARPPNEPIPANCAVSIVGADRLTLIVEAERRAKDRGSGP